MVCWYHIRRQLIWRGPRPVSVGGSDFAETVCDEVGGNLAWIVGLLR